jgi:hypothetical protein
LASSSRGTYCGEENRPSHEEGNMDNREIVRIVWRRYCGYILLNMYENILKGREEKHPCICCIRKVLFKTISDPDLANFENL